MDEPSRFLQSWTEPRGVQLHHGLNHPWFPSPWLFCLLFFTLNSKINWRASCSTETPDWRALPFQFNINWHEIYALIWPYAFYLYPFFREEGGRALCEVIYPPIWSIFSGTSYTNRSASSHDMLRYMVSDLYFRNVHTTINKDTADLLMTPTWVLFSFPSLVILQNWNHK